MGLGVGAGGSVRMMVSTVVDGCSDAWLAREAATSGFEASVGCSVGDGAGLEVESSRIRMSSGLLVVVIAGVAGVSGLTSSSERATMGTLTRSNKMRLKTEAC